MLTEYVKIKYEEFKNILFICFVLTVMFSFTYLRFTTTDESILSVYLIFFLFTIILLSLKLLFMKLIAYKNAFQIHLRLTYFDRYWFRNYDRLSYYSRRYNINSNFKGIPSPFISLILYILTLGIVIFPSIWNYTFTKIPHRFLGTKQKYESEFFHEATNYRYSKALFGGYLFYLIFALFLKSINTFLGSYYYWFLFITFWIAFITIIPILGTEGYELYMRGKLGWIGALTILILGLISLLVFESIAFIVFMTIITAIITLIIILWKQMT